MNRLLWISLFGLALTSCASINQSTLFEYDDVYYTNDIQHRLNQTAILMNKEVAMPDSAYEYFDETYATKIRPSYTHQMQAFDEDDSTSSYFVEEDYNEEYYEDNGQTNRLNRWMNNISVGVGLVSYGAAAYYGGGFYNAPFYPSYHSVPTYYYGGANSFNSVVYTNTTPESYQGYTPPGTNRLSVPNITPPAQRNTYVNPNPSYNAGGNQNRQYKTRGSDSQGGFWSSPGYTPSTSGGSRSGGFAPAGNVGGFRRR